MNRNEPREAIAREKGEEKEKTLNAEMPRNAEESLLGKSYNAAGWIFG
jgi:hypothetical protein